MKRKLLSLILALGIAVAASANTPFLSIRAGVNFADLYNSSFYTESQTGFNAAVLYNIPVTPTLPVYLQSGIGVEMKGAQNSGIFGNIIQSDLKSYMLEVPLVVKVDIKVGAKTAVVPMLGIYYSFAFAGTLEGGETTIHQYQKQTLYLSGGESIDSRLMRQSDMGIRAGLGFKYNNYTLGFAYDAGVMNVFAKELRDIGYKAYSGAWSINLEYRFKN